MQSLFEMTESTLYQNRRSLKGLPKHIRSAINLKWFNELQSTRGKIAEKILCSTTDDLKTELPKGETGCYCCQDCSGDCGFPHEISFWMSIPMLSRDRCGWNKKGYLYRADTSNTLTLIMASSHLDLGCDQEIISAYLLPETYRRLQAILIHLVRPRVKVSNLHIGSIESACNAASHHLPAKRPWKIYRREIAHAWEYL